MWGYVSWLRNSPPFMQPEIKYRVYKSSPTTYNLSHMIPEYSVWCYLSIVFQNIPTGSFPTIYNQDFLQFVTSPTRASCPIYPPWIRSANNIGDDYKLCSSPLCNFLQSPVTSSLLGPNILLCNLLTLIMLTLRHDLCMKSHQSLYLPA
jgi:hypothetical protein